MVTCAQPVSPPRAASRPVARRLIIVLLAVGLPILAGLAWHLASDNPAWPLMRASMNLCTVHELASGPISPDGLYRVHVVQATLLDRFSETMVFLSPADEPWPIQSADPNLAVLEVAGMRSLDAVTWQNAESGQSPILQLWFTPDAVSNQIHRIQRLWRGVAVMTLTSQPAPGAERLDY